jgi:hypothetical protein
MHVPASGLGRTQHAARHMLRDFAAAGVDEDLEELRSVWKKPPTPPSSDSDAEELAQGRLPWRGALERSRGGTFGDTNPQRRWQQRVRSGSLDYKSGERLGTLHMLRQVASTPQHELLPPWPAGDGVSMSTALVVSAGGVGVGAGRGWHARASTRGHGPTEIERAARRSSGATMDWAEWESRWAEELRNLAAAAEHARRMREPPSQREPSSCDGFGRRRTQRSSPPGSRQQQHGRRPPSPGARWRQRDDAPPPHARPARPEPPPPPRQQTPPPPPPPPPRAAPAPHAAPAPIGRSFASWAAFDAAFVAFEASLLSLSSVDLRDVPFPPPDDPAGLVEAGLLRGGGDASRRKKLLHKALRACGRGRTPRAMRRGARSLTSCAHACARVSSRAPHPGSALAP